MINGYEFHQVYTYRIVQPTSGYIINVEWIALGDDTLYYSFQTNGGDWSEARRASKRLIGIIMNVESTAVPKGQENLMVSYI